MTMWISQTWKREKRKIERKTQVLQDQNETKTYDFPCICLCAYVCVYVCVRMYKCASSCMWLCVYPGEHIRISAYAYLLPVFDMSLTFILLSRASHKTTASLTIHYIYDVQSQILIDSATSFHYFSQSLRMMMMAVSLTVRMMRMLENIMIKKKRWWFTDLLKMSLI